jgi:hypothetical protein
VSCAVVLVQTFRLATVSSQIMGLCCQGEVMIGRDKNFRWTIARRSLTSRNSRKSDPQPFSRWINCGTSEIKNNSLNEGLLAPHAQPSGKPGSRTEGTGVGRRQALLGMGSLGVGSLIVHSALGKLGLFQALDQQLHVSVSNLSN